MEEEWKIIEGFPNYSVSNFGNTRNEKFGWQLNPSLLNVGYRLLGLRKKGHDKYFYETVHRLVATAFCEKPEGCNDVDHIDGNRQNNHYQNLRWVTRSHNLRNKKKKDNTSSRFIGVTFSRYRNKWEAKCCINRKTIHFGRFDTEEEAKNAWRQGVRERGLEKYYRDF